MKIQRHAHLSVTLHSAAASLVGPTDIITDLDYGESIAAWKAGVGGPSFGNIELELTSPGAATIADGKLIGKVSDAGNWVILGDLYGGAVITLAATYGWTRVLGGVSIYKYLGLLGTVAVSTITVKATPLEYSEAAG